jgi:hypothetical protein
VRLGIAGFRVFVRRRQTFLKKWSQNRVLVFYEALFAIMEAAFYAKRHLEGLGKC